MSELPLPHAPARRARERLRAVRALFVVLAVGLALGGCARPPCRPLEPGPRTIPASRVAHPPFFRVESDSGATLVLLGTLHLGPTEGWILSPPTRRALERADAVVLEIDLREANEESVSTLVANRALLEPGVRLEDRIEPETRALLATHDDAITRLGFPPKIRSLMKPWFLALGLIESSTGGSGLTVAAAVERQILADLDDRPLIALETTTEQIDLFDGLPPALQDLILRDTLARLDESEASTRSTVRAWQVGDSDLLSCLAREGTEELPGLEAFYAVLLDERNRAWQTRLEGLLEAPDRSGELVFVAVGALHLVGPAGLPELLREAGYDVEEIEHGQETEPQS
ncbi:MAG: TraB/GumN family protein [bacterium]